VHGFASNARAAAEWTNLEDSLERRWTDHATMIERYEAFCELDGAARAALLSWAIARTLHASPSGSKPALFLDHLGRKLDIDVTGWWRPTAQNYFDRISKPAILDLLGQVGSTELRQRYASSRKHDLASSAENLFSGEAIVEADIRARLMQWLPDAMRFSAPPGEDAMIAGEVPQTDQGNDDLQSDGDGDVPSMDDAA
jgi:ParB family transcriptional regulator, chromosome partitioning protein